MWILGWNSWGTTALSFTNFTAFQSAMKYNHYLVLGGDRNGWTLQPCCLSPMCLMSILGSHNGLVWSIVGHCHGSRARQLRCWWDTRCMRQKGGGGTSLLVYRSCLLSARHLADFTVMSLVPGLGRQTDKVTIRQQGPSGKMDATRAECCQDHRVNKETSKGTFKSSIQATDRSCHCTDTQGTNYQC